MHAIEKEDDIAFPMIIHALGLLGDVRAFNAIAVHLQSANSYHRGLAADALGHLGDRRAGAALDLATEPTRFLARRSRAGNKRGADCTGSVATAIMIAASAPLRFPFA